VAGDNKTGKGGEFVADRTKGVADGIACGGFVVVAGKRWSP
jgi:dipeptide/tripeptide permease